MNGMKNFWMNTFVALVALVTLLTSGGALAQTHETQSKASEQQWEAIENEWMQQANSIEQQAKHVEQWQAELMMKIREAADALPDDVRERMKAQSESKTRWLQTMAPVLRNIAPALRSDLKNLEQVIPRINASLDPYIARLEKIPKISDCKADKADDSCPYRTLINTLGLAKSGLQFGVKLRRQATELMLEFTTLNPENSADAERIEEIQLEFDDVFKQIDEFQLDRPLKEIHPYNPRVSENMVVRWYFGQGDYAETLKWALREVAAAEQYTDKDKQHHAMEIAYLNVAQAYAELGQPAQALAWYQRALPLIGDDPFIYNRIASGYEQQADYAKAMVWYQKALAIKDYEGAIAVESYLGIAKVYDRQGDTAKALEWNLKAATSMEEAAYAPMFGDQLDESTRYYDLATIYEHQGDIEKALPAYIKAYRIRVKKHGRADSDTKAARDSLKRVYLQINNPQPFSQWLKEQQEQSEK